MKILIVIGVVYLILGLIYGIYLVFRKSSSVWALPINILGGPITVVYIIYTVIKRKRIRYY